MDTEEGRCEWEWIMLYLELDLEVWQSVVTSLMRLSKSVVLIWSFVSLSCVDPGRFGLPMCGDSSPQLCDA
jgi:hypothetical protein